MYVQATYICVRYLMLRIMYVLCIAGFIVPGCNIPAQYASRGVFPCHHNYVLSSKTYHMNSFCEKLSEWCIAFAPNHDMIMTSVKPNDSTMTDYHECPVMWLGVYNLYVACDVVRSV